MRRTAAFLVLGISMAALLLPGFCPEPALAQGGFDMTVFPAKVEMGATPGNPQEFFINLRNGTTEDQLLNVYFNDYFISPDNEFVFRKPGHYSYSCAKWLSTDSGELSVPAGQLARKRFVLSVPEDAEPGGHYAVIFFEQAAAPGEGAVAAKPRIGALVLVTVPGEIVRKGEIKSVSVTSSWFWPSRKVLAGPKRVTRARVVFGNEGNVHLTVRGRLTYTPTFGWGAGTVDLEEMTVLPGTERHMDATLPNPPLLGSYKVSAEVSYGPSLEVFDTTLTKEGAFHQYPSFLLLIPLALAAVAAALVILLKRLRRKRKGKGVEHVDGRAMEGPGAGSGGKGPEEEAGGPGEDGEERSEPGGADNVIEVEGKSPEAGEDDPPHGEGI